LEICINKKAAWLNIFGHLFGFVIVPLIFGLFIYLIWRPTNIMYFSWIEILKLDGNVFNLRLLFYNTNSYIPGWFVYSLPNALWFLALHSFLVAVWKNNSAKLTLILCFFGAFIELLQMNKVIPGDGNVEDALWVILMMLSSNYLNKIYLRRCVQ